MRHLLTATFLALTACTASWNSQVRYSDTKAPPAESATEGVYAAIFRSFLNLRRDTVVIVDAAFLEGEPGFGAGLGQLPHEWADTLKHEVEAALEDTGRAARPQGPALLAAASRLGIRLVPSGQMGQVYERSTRPIPILSMGVPGFNGDTTIATVTVGFLCGPLCGSGGTVYLARRPGHAWRIWRREVTWVS